jgi:8-amino-7-oxononanoate synthase
VIGERRHDELSPYGARGNSIVRYTGESYDNLILVGGFSKAYSSLLAFIACPTAVKDLLKVAAPPYLYSGPSPVASLATVLVGLDVNEQRGDALRAELHRLTTRTLDGLHRLGVHTPNVSGLPIIEIPLRDHTEIDAVGRHLFARGVYVTLAAYPLVPKDEVGFRAQLTSANTDGEVDLLLEVVGELVDRDLLKPADQPPALRHAA